MATVAWDTETKGLHWDDPEERAFLVQWATDKGEWDAEPTDPVGSAAALKALSTADVLVAHNASFDVHQVRATWGVDLLDTGAELHDTDLMSRILHPEGQRKDRGGHGLKNLAKVYLREDAQRYENAIVEAGKQIGYRTLKGPGRYYDVFRAYPDVMRQYARMDARYTYDLFHDFLPRFRHQDPRLWDLYQLEMKVCRVLIRAEQRGTCIDTDAVESLRRHYQALRKQEVEQLERHLGFVPEGQGSEEQLVEALQSQGVPLCKTTPGGQLSVAEWALREFAQDYPVIQHLLEFRRVGKFLSTYIEPMRDRTTVHPSFRQCAAWTGRMSCTNPNMQNLPKRRDTDQTENLRVRSMFVPRAEHSFIVADYEGIESRVLAHYLGNRDYRQLFEEGRDPHALTASVIWGGQPEDYAKSSPKRWMRDVAKNTTFAITYGAGAPKVLDTINRMVKPEHRVGLPEARRIVSRVKDALPGYRALQSRIKEKIVTTGHVTTIMGRKQIVPPDKYYVGLNALIQGSAADIMKQGLTNVADAIKAFDGYPLLVVHDEVVIEVPTVEAPAALPVVVDALENAWDLSPRLAVEAKVTGVSYAHA